MRKLFNGDNERDEENGTISIIQKKTGARAIIPLVLLAEEIINKYIGKESKYYKERRTELNNDIRLIAQEAGLDEPITYEEDGIKYTKPLYELLHTHLARHTFSTIMCRRGVPREDIIIATGHEDTQMLDKIYAHLTAKDKSKKVTSAFKKKLGDGIFDMGSQPEPEKVPEHPSGERLMNQCLVGQRISDMRKLFNGDNERDEENGTISIIQKKTGARAIIPLVLLAEEIINKYIGKESKYYKERRTELNNDIRLIAQEAGLDEPITYEEDGIKYTKPLYELLHTHLARHTFSTIMCRRGVPREDIIIATGHEDTQMLDKIYAHLTAKDKSKKVTSAFKKKLGDGIFDMGSQPEPEKVPEHPSGERLMNMDCNLILRMIKEGIAEGLKPLQQELADVRQVIRHITGHKRVNGGSTYRVL